MSMKGSALCLLMILLSMMLPFGSAVFAGEESATVKDKAIDSLHYKKGITLLSERRFSDAVQEFEAAAKENPKSADVHYRLALSLIMNSLQQNSSIPARAVEELEKVISNNPGYRNAYLLLAMYHYSRCADEKNLSNAISCYDKFITLAPGDDSSSASQVEFAKTRKAELASLLEQARPLMKAVEKNGSDTKLLSELGEMFFSHYAFIQAEEMFRKALEISPEDGRASLGIARVLFEKYMIEKLEATGSGAQDRRKNNAENAQKEIAGLAMKRNLDFAKLHEPELQQVLGCCATALSSSHPLGEAFLYRGMVYDELGEDDKACENYRNFLTHSENAKAVDVGYAKKRIEELTKKK